MIRRPWLARRADRRRARARERDAPRRLAHIHARFDELGVPVYVFDMAIGDDVELSAVGRLDYLLGRPLPFHETVPRTVSAVIRPSP